MRLSTIALGVRDLEAAVAFYQRGLGWPIRSRRGDLVTFETGPTRLCLYPADALAAFAGGPPSPPGPTVLHSVNVDSEAEVDRIIQSCSDFGGTTSRPPGPLPWGGYGACVRDPDGHPWEIVHAG